MGRTSLIAIGDTFAIGRRPILLAHRTKAFLNSAAAGNAITENTH
jgi:hypothetical protein